YKTAVFIGGGLLGLEAANGLKSRGMDVTVVHLMPWLMERQLDKAAAALLQKTLEAKGLRFKLEATTEALVGTPSPRGSSTEGGAIGHEGRGEGKPRVEAVRLKSGETIPADLVVMAVGIRPNTDLAQAAGRPC